MSGEQLTSSKNQWRLPAKVTEILESNCKYTRPLSVGLELDQIHNINPDEEVSARLAVLSAVRMDDEDRAGIVNASLQGAIRKPEVISAMISEIAKDQSSIEQFASNITPEELVNSVYGLKHGTGVTGDVVSEIKGIKIMVNFCRAVVADETLRTKLDEINALEEQLLEKEVVKRSKAILSPYMQPPGSKLDKSNRDWDRYDEELPLCAEREINDYKESLDEARYRLYEEYVLNTDDADEFRSRMNIVIDLQAKEGLNLEYFANIARRQFIKKRRNELFGGADVDPYTRLVYDDIATLIKDLNSFFMPYVYGSLYNHHTMYSAGVSPDTIAILGAGSGDADTDREYIRLTEDGVEPGEAMRQLGAHFGTPFIMLDILTRSIKEWNDSSEDNNGAFSNGLPGLGDPYKYANAGYLQGCHVVIDRGESGYYLSLYSGGYGANPHIMGDYIAYLGKELPDQM